MIHGLTDSPPILPRNLLQRYPGGEESAATHLLQGGYDIRTVQALLGQGSGLPIGPNPFR